MARRALMLREGRAPVWDRLLTMLFLATLLHGMIILGVTFNAAASAKGSAPGLEVLLVSDELPTADKNPNATYLAQRTQLGSGNTRDPVAARNRAAAVPLQPHAGSAEGNSLAETGHTGSVRDKPLLIDAVPTAQPGPQDEQGPAQLRGPQREELWVTPDTRESVLAPYLDAWRRKVERIGTVNYPTVARAAAGAANPVLEVGIGASGNLDRAIITRSSGNPELDQAALEILKLASPFEPFPPELAAKYQVLRFAYEWQFVGGRVGHGRVTASD